MYLKFWGADRQDRSSKTYTDISSAFLMFKCTFQSFSCVFLGFFVVLMTTMVVRIPSEASLGVFRLNGSVVSPELPLSHELALAFLQRCSNEVLGAKGFCSNRAHLMKRRWRRGQQTLRHHHHGNSCWWCSAHWHSGVVKGSKTFDCRAFLMVDRSLDPALPVMECWGNTQRKHWQEATRLYRETPPPAVIYLWQTVVSFFFFWSSPTNSWALLTWLKPTGVETHH